jgi:ParB-like chromosome segregation protein Spo0J
MCSSIREYGFQIPVLARSDGEVVDGHLHIKAACKLRTDEIPVILCDEWTQAQVKAFRLMVNRSVTWASWDDEVLALELSELSEPDFDLSLTGFDPGEIDALLVDPEDDEKANAAPGQKRTTASKGRGQIQPGVSRRTQLLEAPHRGSYGNHHQRRHAGRLVRGVRAGAQP